MVILYHVLPSYCFFFNDTATTEIYTLSLHDALPISAIRSKVLLRIVMLLILLVLQVVSRLRQLIAMACRSPLAVVRSEEYTSELQSRQYLVCRLLLEKKKPTHHTY